LTFDVLTNVPKEFIWYIIFTSQLNWFNVSSLRTNVSVIYIISSDNSYFLFKENNNFDSNWWININKFKNTSPIYWLLENMISIDLFMDPVGAYFYKTTWRNKETVITINWTKKIWEKIIMIYVLGKVIFDSL
jgi:hypothetical protein